MSYVEYTIVARNTTDKLSTMNSNNFGFYLPKIRYGNSGMYVIPDESNIEVTLQDGTITTGSNILASQVKSIKITYPSDSIGIRFVGIDESRPVYLKSIIHMDVNNFTTMEYMFVYCTKLTDINTSNWIANRVTIFYQAFAYCTALQNLDLSNVNTKNATSSDNMFIGWTSSQVVYVGENWTIDTSSYDATFINLSTVKKIAVYTFDNTISADCPISLRSSESNSFNDFKTVDTVNNNITHRTIYVSNDVIITRMQIYYQSSLLTVEYMRIDENITYCGGLVANAKNLTYINMDNWDTKNVKNMDSMFMGCELLTDLNLSHLNTSQVEDMRMMFWGCKSLQNLNVIGWNTSKVVDMYGMFGSCPMTTLDISSFDTSSVTEYDSMFSGFSSAQNVYVGKKWTLGTSGFGASIIVTNTFTYTLAKYTFNKSVADCLPTITGATSSQWVYSDSVDGNITTRTIGTDDANVKPTAYNFNDQKSLLSIDYIKIDSNVTSLYRLVRNCTRVTYVNTQGWDVSNVTTCDSMCSGASALPSIDLSNLNFTKPVNFQYMFQNCTDLTEVNTTNFKASPTSMASMFYQCNDLKSIDLSDCNLENVTTMYRMFSNCAILASIKFSNDNSVPKLTNTSYMFYDCAFTSIDLSTFYNTTALTNMSYMFGSCDKLKTINLSNWDTSAVTTFRSLFQNCSALESVNLSNWNTEKVTTMIDMFSGCSQLTTLDLLGFNTEKVTSMNSMFDGCSSLISLDLSSFNTENVENTGNMFKTCTLLTVLDLSNWNTINTTTMSNMFNGATKITDIGLLYSSETTINKITGVLPNIPKNIFYYDADETQLTPVEGVTFKKYKVPTTIQLPPHIQLYGLPDGTRDEVDIKTGILIRRTQKIDNGIVALESPTTEQLILNYNNSCDYGRILPTGMSDKYDVVNSMYTQTMTSILLDGANIWDAMEEFDSTVKFTATGTTVGVEDLNMLGAGGLYCDNDLFPNINDDSDVPHCRVDGAGNKFYIYVDKEMLMSPDLLAWQIWLQENKFNMIYELAEHLTYVKPYEELDPTQARWEGMDCMRDGAIKYNINSSDDFTIYPTLEYVAPSINNFEVPMLEPNTVYTVYAKGINDNDTINLGGADIQFKDGIVCTSGDNQWLRIDNNDSFHNIVITKGDTTGEVVPYFEGMTSIENPKVQCGESTVSYTNLKLRSLPNGVKDTINVVTGEYVQRVGEREYQDGDLTNENILTDGINTMYELENYIITKLDTQTLLAYTDGTINLSSDTGLLPTIHYAVPLANTFYLPSMKTGTRYTLKYPSASGSITIGDINYNISSDSMLFTTPLKINGDVSGIIFSDTNPKNVVLLEGAYNKREVPFFTGVKSVKNPNITIIDQLSTESKTYNCETEIELKGLPNGIADKLDMVKGKLTTNVGIRPYQDGDEELDNVWTDGYETVYALSSPIVTNVEIETPYVTTNSLIELSSDHLIPQLNYRAPSSNNFPLDLLQPNQTYTLYADTSTSGSYTLGGTRTGIYSQPHTITLGDMTDNLLTFNGDLGLNNVMLVKGNSLKTTLPPYFLGIRSVTDGYLLVEGMAGEMNELTFDEGIVLRDCNGVKDTIDLITCTLTKRTGEITLTGAEGWSLANTSQVITHNDYVTFQLTLGGVTYSNPTSNGVLICDTLKHEYQLNMAHEKEGIYSVANAIRICIKKSRIGGDTINALKSWLNQNPTTVVYPLATPLEIPLKNVWTTSPPTSYDNQTEISSTVSSDSLKPMISVTIATTTLEEIVSSLEAQNAQLKEESLATMLALTEVYEMMYMSMVEDIDIESTNAITWNRRIIVTSIGMVYAKLVKRGVKFIEEIPAKLRAEVQYAIDNGLV